MTGTETLLIGANLLILAILGYIAFILRRCQQQGRTSTTAASVAKPEMTDKEQLFDILVENAPCSVIAISAGYQVLLINEVAAAITGITREAALGRKCYEVFADGSVCPDCLVAKALATAKRHTQTMRLCDHAGAVKYIEQTGIPVLAGNGSVSYVLAFGLDITGTRELEHQNQQLAVETVTSLAKLIGNRDQYTGEHSARVRDIALAIGREVKLPADLLSELAIAAVLHDIGKIGIPEQILNKTGKLTESEYAIIQRHPQLGYDALVNIKQLEKVAEYILYHHECYDGRGYPSKKAGEEIPLISRILSIADVYEAITSDRVYRKAMNLEQTIMVMRAGRGTKFDPEILDAFFCFLRRERPESKLHLQDEEAAG